MKDKISIIIPIYNCENYVKNCINSLLEQTYSNIEILLIDDGSTDNSYEVCKKFSMKDNRIKVFHKENGGVSSARNFGIKVSTGEYISFIDSDDWVDERYCEILLNGIKKEADLSVVGFNQTKEVKKITVSYDDNYEVLNTNEAYRYIFREFNFFGFPWNKLYKKSIIELLGDKPFDEDIHACEDTLFNSRYLTKCSNNIVYNKSHLYCYYQRLDSATKIKEVNSKKLSVFKSLDEIEKIYLEFSKENLVYLYIFYLYNYYLLQILIINTKSSIKLDKKNAKRKFKYILKSKKIGIVEKIKIIVKFKFPRINDKLNKIKKKIKE